eukprot:tig00000219_g19508.t1
MALQDPGGGAIPSALQRISALLDASTRSGTGHTPPGSNDSLASLGGGLGSLCLDSSALEAETAIPAYETRRTSVRRRTSGSGATSPERGGGQPQPQADADAEDEEEPDVSAKRSAVERGRHIELRAIAAARSLLASGSRPQSPSASSVPGTPPIFVHDEDGDKEVAEISIAARLQRPRARSYGSDSENSRSPASASEAGGSSSRRSAGAVLLSGADGVAPLTLPHPPLPKSGSASSNARSPRSPFVRSPSGTARDSASPRAPPAPGPAPSASGFGSLAASIGMGMAAAASPPGPAFLLAPLPSSASSSPSSGGAAAALGAPSAASSLPPFAARRSMSSGPSPIEMPPRSPLAHSPRTATPSSTPGSPAARSPLLPGLSSMPRNLPPLPERAEGAAGALARVRALGGQADHGPRSRPESPGSGSGSALAL